jgi:hypothetical protein
MDECGIAPWGGLPVTAPTGYVRHVLGSYAGGDGDGSRERPFRTIAEAIATAAPDDVVAIGASDAGEVYDEGVGLPFALKLRGRCPGKVLLTGKAGTIYAGMDAGITSYKKGPVEVSGLTIGGPGSGIVLYGGSGHRLSNLRVEGNDGMGIALLFAKDVQVSFATVAGNRHGGAIAPGEGFHVEGSDDVTIESCSVAGNTAHGILVLDGSSIAVQRSRVAGTLVSAKGDSAFGITVAEGSHADVTGCMVEDNRGMGVLADYGSTLVLSDTVIRGTEVLESDGQAHGLDVRLGSSAEVTRTAVIDNAYLGVFVTDASLQLSDSIVRGTRTVGPQNGRGIDIQGRDSVVGVVSTTVAENADAGLVVDGSSLTVRDAVVRDTATDSEGRFGRGLNVQGGATALVEGTLFAANRDAGVMVHLSNLTLRDSEVRDTEPESAAAEPGFPAEGRGLETSDATGLVVEHCRFQGNTGEALHLSGTPAAIAATVVSDTRTAADGDFGRGIVVTDGTKLTLTDTLVERNRDIGILVTDAEASLRDTVVRSQAPTNLPDGGGWGMDVQGSKVVAERCAFVANTQIGIRVLEKGDLTLADSLVQDTRSYDDGNWGHGMQALGDSTVAIRRSAFIGNREDGLLVSGSRLTLEDTVIADTLPTVWNGSGPGLTVQHAAIVDVVGSVLARNSGYGALAMAGQLGIRDSLIAGTLPDETGYWGVGVGCQGGGRLTATWNRVADSRATGINLVSCWATVEDNAIEGVGFSKGKWIVDEETVEIPSGTADGIVAVTSFDVEVRRNRVEGAGRAGLVVDTTTGLAEANRVLGAGLFCAVVQNVGPDFVLGENLFLTAGGDACEPRRDSDDPLPVSNTEAKEPEPVGGTEDAESPR